MPTVLTTADALSCSFHGKIAPDGAAKLAAGGAKVLTKGGLANKPVTACGATGSPPPICTKVDSISAGVASKLLVGGDPVLLSGLVAKAMPNSHPVGPVSATQTKLVAS